ncbi:hypothetical protein F5I97DRAFT_1929059 [Phlebopus sp. FC_14]|nr:hypothetical protein F5I97DRAFT_1929059 [Phlebopus sp. FC_14]
MTTELYPDERQNALNNRPIANVDGVFKEYIFNTMPTHLIHLSGDGWQLVGRADLCALFRPLQSPDEASLSKEQIIGRLVKPVLRYAILSHRWLDKEITYQDMSKGENLEGKAYEKLLGFCTMAELHSCSLAWSDMCCIDKTNSVEMDEAIRSMFNWYRNAHICVVHLSGTLKNENIITDPWFTRGWTLQELLAPATMKFYDSTWQEITGTPNDKVHEPMLDALHRATGIPKEDISRFVPATDRIQEKMRWASKRQTTRIEDAAYSLLGIFDVSIPTAYGEGHASFHRLMEEIIRTCDEIGIFAWAGPSSGRGNTAAIPRSPRCYGDDDFVGFPAGALDQLHGDRDFSLTRRGLQIKLTFVKGTLSPTNDGAFTFVPGSPVFQNTIIHTSWLGTLTRDETWALAILNYQRGVNNRSVPVAIIHPGKVYLCWLCIMTDNGSCRKITTSSVVTIRTHPGNWYDSRAPLGEPYYL